MREQLALSWSCRGAERSGGAGFGVLQGCFGGAAQGRQELPIPGVGGGDGLQLPMGSLNTQGDWRTLGCPNVFVVPWSHRWMLGVMPPYPPRSCCCSDN